MPIGHGTGHHQSVTALIFLVGSACREAGDCSGGDPPVPIPNTVVKPSSPDDTAGEAPWDNRTLPASPPAEPVPLLSLLRNRCFIHCVPLRVGRLVTVAEGTHPFPSRTRSLSPPAPTILRGKPRGTIGRCRPPYAHRHPSFAWPEARRFGLSALSVLH